MISFHLAVTVLSFASADLASAGLDSCADVDFASADLATADLASRADLAGRAELPLPSADLVLCFFSFLLFCCFFELGFFGFFCLMAALLRLCAFDLGFLAASA